MARDESDQLLIVKIIGVALALLVGWGFILATNRFHATAPVVIVCLAYLAVVMTVVNFWRTGAAAAAPVDADEEWGRPQGAKGALEKEKRTLLKAIKEAEFDQAMGKLSQADAESLIATYRARAVEVIKEIDRLGDTADLSVRDQIEREVKARLELAAQDKPSNRAKNAAKKHAKPEPKAELKTEPAAAPTAEAPADATPSSTDDQAADAPGGAP